ncbi:vacuolar lysine transporter YPQ1-like [Curcuma longa]|uniref:vacuolar lysine transporter YPQ1-like n=1 Tax=Curcuma longa TaxID=136217 RepID=UPI003D9F0E35
MAHSKASSRPTCSSQHCSDWARIYLKYCLCSAKDGVAIFLGTVSIISWGVAEVPQILTNFREKSTKGLSVAFLMTWVIGDLFNLIGCILEPATLPTQFYVALLYTATTAILTGQTIYYGHTDWRHKSNKDIVSSQVRHQSAENESLLGDAKKSNVGGCKGNAASLSEESNTQSSPIPVTGPLSPSDSNGRNFYFVSARSLSKSPVPIFGTWLAYSHEDGISHHLNDGHHDQQFAATEPLLSSQSAPTKFSTKNMLSVVPSTGLLICICVYHLCFHDNTEPHGMVVQVGRKLLQNELQGNEASGAGTLLGWMMAAIYVGGRLPQICLNIRRGNVQGLNPLMFIFALVGNITYVGSILVKSLAWSAIKPNLPWLVDAGGCAILDAFISFNHADIVIQFVYFRFRQPNKSASDNNLA